MEYRKEAQRHFNAHLSEMQLLEKIRVIRNLKIISYDSHVVSDSENKILKSPNKGFFTDNKNTLETKI